MIYFLHKSECEMYLTYEQLTVMCNFWNLSPLKTFVLFCSIAQYFVNDRVIEELRFLHGVYKDKEKVQIH